MNYEKIANLVHECVKNPAKLVENKLEKKEAKTSEANVVYNVCSKYQVSGGVVAIGNVPLTMW